MICDRFRKKANKPNGGGGNAATEVTDLKDQVPNIGELLGEIDGAIEKAVLLAVEIEIQNSKRRCTC